MDDDALAELLRGVVDEADPVPTLVDVAAFAALSTRRLDDELAELVADSELDAAGAVRGRRGDDRLLTFQWAAGSVELQLSAAGELRGLVGGAQGAVVVESAGSSRTAELDAAGWFGLDSVAPGPLRLRLLTSGGVAVVTSWVSV